MPILYVLHYDRLMARIIILSLILMFAIFLDFFVTHQSQKFLKSFANRFYQIED